MLQPINLDACYKWHAQKGREMGERIYCKHVHFLPQYKMLYERKQKASNVLLDKKRYL